MQECEIFGRQITCTICQSLSRLPKSDMLHGHGENNTHRLLATSIMKKVLTLQERIKSKKKINKAKH